MVLPVQAPNPSQDAARANRPNLRPLARPARLAATVALGVFLNACGPSHPPLREPPMRHSPIDSGTLPRPQAESVPAPPAQPAPAPTPDYSALSPTGRLLARTQDDFNSVLTRKSALPASSVLSAIDAAQQMLLDLPDPALDMQRVAVARLENGQFFSMQVLASPRPQSGQRAGSDDGRFEITRADSTDLGGMFSQLQVRELANPSAHWVVLAAQVHPPARTRPGHLIVCPYEPALDGGALSRQGLAYLYQMDSSARQAIGRFDSNPSHQRLLSQLPSHSIVILALVEHLYFPRLQSGPQFQDALGRLLYHLATARNQSKSMTTSPAGAGGLLQFMPSTIRRLEKYYQGAPSRVYLAWAQAAHYAPAIGQTSSQRLRDPMYQSILAHYHHFNTLSWLKSKPSLAAGLSTPPQLLCALNAAYNGGPHHAQMQICSAPPSGWEQAAFERGLSQFGQPDAVRSESYDYTLKSLVIANALPTSLQSPAPELSTSPSYARNAQTLDALRAASVKPIHSRHYSLKSKTAAQHRPASAHHAKRNRAAPYAHSKAKARRHRLARR